MKYYVRRQLYTGGYEYIVAPSGWAWKESGIIRDGTDPQKSGPEMSTDPYKRHLFNSYRGAKIQANKIPGSEILTC